MALSQSMILSGMLPHGVRQMGEYISQMTSVERVLQYDTIEEEKGLDKGSKNKKSKYLYVTKKNYKILLNFRNENS